MTDSLIHTVTDCNPERVNPIDCWEADYKLRSYLFDSEQAARDFMSGTRPAGPLGFTYCQQWWSEWSFDNFLHTDHRKGA